MPDLTPDPLQAFSKASSIGPARIGDRYLPQASDSLIHQLLTRVMGPERPPSVAAADPYGIGAYEKGAGPFPMMAGTIKPVIGAGLLNPHPAIRTIMDLLSHDPYAGEAPAQAAAREFFGEAKGKQALPGMRQEARMGSMVSRPDTSLSRPGLRDLHVMDVADKLGEASPAPVQVSTPASTPSQGRWPNKKLDKVSGDFMSKFSLAGSASPDDMEAIRRALRSRW